MNQQAERRVGTVIGGKWRVDSLLGSGSMAAVYGVTHRNGARAALKILHPTLCTDPSVCERFLGEGYLTNSVKHAGIVRVNDDGVTDDGCVFLVMDLLEGRTLEALRQERGGEIPLKEILDIADKLMDALHAVHVGGIIHRDLKPQNVFICNDGSVKLLDFGVARVFDQTAQSKLSAFGLVLGTPSFMSPEQALGARDKVDHRSDIWSLGATLFTAISGQTVHLGPHVQAKLLAAATIKARSISMVKPDLPAPLAGAIDMALRFKQEDRWQTVEAFRRAFREARLQVGLGKPDSVPPPSFSIDDDDHGGASMDDAPTHVDNGERAPAVMVRTKQEQHRRRRDDPRSDRPPPPVPRGRPGPHGTFIGIGSPTSDAPPPLPNKKARSSRPPPVPNRPSSSPEHHPYDAMRSSQQDGSYPAVGSTLQHHGNANDTASAMAQVGPRRGGGIGVWIAAFALVIAAASGIAFFAVNRASVGGRAGGVGVTTAQSPMAAPSMTATASASAPSPNANTPHSTTTTALSMSSAFATQGHHDAGAQAAAGNSNSSNNNGDVAKTAAFQPRPAQPSPGNARSTRSRAGSPAPQDPQSSPLGAPTAAPDPFGTPD